MELNITQKIQLLNILETLVACAPSDIGQQEIQEKTGLSPATIQVQAEALSNSELIFLKIDGLDRTYSANTKLINKLFSYTFETYSLGSKLKNEDQ